MRVLAPGLDPGNGMLSEIMTSPVAMLSPADSRMDAVALMQK